MKSMWNGTAGVSLLVFPIKLGSAVGDSKLELHQVRKSDGSRIRYRRYAEADGPAGEEVRYGDIGKGYEAPDGSIVVLSDEDFEAAYGEKSREAKITMFTDATAVPRIALDSAYHVQPGKGGEKAYALLADAMFRAGKVAIMTIALREREFLAVLSPDEENPGYLLLTRLTWYADIRRPDFPVPLAQFSDAERAMADQLIEAHSGIFSHSGYRDESQERLTAIVQAKIEANQVIAAATPAQASTAHSGPQQAMDLMTMLRGSVDAANAAKAPVKAKRTRKPKATVAA